MRASVIVFGSLIVATLAAAGVVWSTQPSPDVEVYELPYAIELETPPVQASERGVPRSVLDTAHQRVTGRAPGLRLVRVRDHTDWSQRRAVIEDLVTTDRRAYAIGDLLPHGALLVAIGHHTADVLIADAELIRLTKRGPRPLEDFRVGYEVQALQPVADLAPEYRDAVENAVRMLRTQTATVVQAHLDELVACGDPAVEILIDHVDDPLPVPPHTYDIDGLPVTPLSSGDLVIAVLERITGQTFGDPMAADVTPSKRREISSAWRRWWGL